MSIALTGLVRSLYALRPHDLSAQAEVAKRFGFAFTESISTETKREPTESVEAPPTKVARPGREELKEDQQAKPIPTKLERVADGTASPPAWLIRNRDPVHHSSTVRATRPSPIIAPLRIRAIVHEIFARYEESSAPDVARLVAMLATGGLIARVPRLRRQSLSPRMLLLLDAGAGMDPFAQDQISFAHSITRLFDPSRIIVRSFVGAPVNGVRHPDLLAVSALDAFRGADVLIISDWGVSRVANDPDRATLADWERSATAVLKLGRAAVLTPYPAARWPKVLHPRLAMIYWHEQLTVGQVRRVFERSRGPKQ